MPSTDRDIESVIGCREAASDSELAAHFEVRRRVFVDEQRIFSRSDRDGIDDQPSTRHLVGYVAEEIVAAVRLYPVDLAGARWKGDRLAVLPEHRTSSFGADLVRLAVSTAASQGGTVMEAMIQLPNVRFFERLGWIRDGEPVVYAGQPHQPMEIALWFDALVGQVQPSEVAR